MAVRVVVLLGLALVIGVGTIIFAQKWIASVQQPTLTETVVREVVPDSFVLVAQGNLRPGMLLGPESFRWQGWPTEDLPPTYIVQGKGTDTEFYGAVVRREIGVGEPIIRSKVAKPGEQGFLAAVLEPGMRAVSIPISETRASAGFILPGDRVDVILTHTAGPGSVSETVFLDMRILAIDQALSNPEGLARVGRTATLEVTPREVEAFTLMQQMGAVSLSLRSLQPQDQEQQQGDGQQMAATGQSDPAAGTGMSEKPEVIDKVPTVYPGEIPEETATVTATSGESVDNAVGQVLGEMDSANTEDEHSIRRRQQTFTSARDVSVLIGGGGGGGSVVVIRGN